MLVDLYKEHLAILDQGPDAFVAELMSRDPAPALEDFGQIIQALDNQAEVVRFKSTDSVCTGLFR